MAWYVLFFTSLITILSGLHILDIKKEFIELWSTLAVGIPIAWIAGRTYEKIKKKEDEYV